MGRIAPVNAEASALILYGAAAALFYLFSRSRVAHAPSYSRGLFVLILLVGTLARWVLAWQTPGNYDRASWEMAAEVFASGGNIYVESARYHYSPVWFWCLGLLREFSQAVPVFSFAVTVRLFLSLVDIGTALLLWTWPKLSAWERARQAAYFYLNPVSVLLTGVHGQFENLCIFFLVFALRLSAHPAFHNSRRGWAWFWGTVAFIVKHNVFYGVIILTAHFFRTPRALRFLSLSFMLFLLTFVPYWEGGKEGILSHVFQYRSHAMPYGLAFLDIPGLSAAFAGALAVYAFTLRDRRLSTKLLLGSLFFLTFTTGFGVQYLVLPVALAALRPTREFFIFTFTAGAYLLGSYFNMGIRMFSWVPLWAVWVAAAYWWFSVHSKPAKTA